MTWHSRIRDQKNFVIPGKINNKQYLLVTFLAGAKLIRQLSSVKNSYLAYYQVPVKPWVKKKSPKEAFVEFIEAFAKCGKPAFKKKKIPEASKGG